MPIGRGVDRGGMGRILSQGTSQQHRWLGFVRVSG